MKQIKRGPKKKFPTPANNKRQDELLFLETQEIVDLFNQTHPDKKAFVKLCPTVKEWFEKEALKNSWLKVMFLKDAKGSSTYKGCALLVAEQIKAIIAIIKKAETSKPSPPIDICEDK